METYGIEGGINAKFNANSNLNNPILENPPKISLDHTKGYNFGEFGSLGADLLDANIPSPDSVG